MEEWLEVDLARQHIVTATETMGRYVGICIFVLGIQYKIAKLIYMYLQPSSRYNWGQIRRFGGGRGQEFATAYSVQYWSSGAWHTYTNLTGHSVMTGNENTWEASVQQLVPPIVTSRVRVLPRSRHPRTVSNNFDDDQVGDNMDADDSGEDGRWQLR